MRFNNAVSKTLYDVTTMTKHSCKKMNMTVRYMRLRPRACSAMIVSAKTMDTPPVIASAFFALRIFIENICGRVIARQRSTARKASRSVEKSSEERKTLAAASFPMLPRLIVSKNAKHTHIDVSATANANIYALIGVVILRRYTTITNRFPGVPRTHKIMFTKSNVALNAVTVGSLGEFLSKFINGSFERHVTFTSDSLHGSMSLVITSHLFLCYE